MTHNDHSHSFSASRSEVIKLIVRFVRGRRALLIRPYDVATLHVVAGEGDFGGGSVGLHLDNGEMAFIRVDRAHSLHRFVLPLKPLHIRGFGDGANDREAIAYLDTLVRTFAQVNVI